MTVLTDVSADLAAVVKAASPTVVRVEGRRRMPATGIVWSADGLILTANHVVRADEGIGVGFEDGRILEATLRGRDRSTDLALLQVEATDLAALPIASEDEMAIGQFVVALGRPGHNVQATLGIISAIGNPWRTRGGGVIDGYVQTDVLMYPGFSGGPLLAADGSLIGLNSSAMVQGVSVALPGMTLRRVANSLQEHGRLRRGYLGVSTQSVRLPQLLAEELGQRRGLLIVGVEPDSPAEQGGLTLGDTIVGVGETTVRNHDDLLATLIDSNLDEKVPVRVVRAGELQVFSVRLGEGG